MLEFWYIYIPSTRSTYRFNFNQGTYKNKFIRFWKWLDSFPLDGDKKYYYGYNTGTYTKTQYDFATTIYNDIKTAPNRLNDNRSLPACLNFNSTGNTYNDHQTTDNTFFYENDNVLETGSDMIKFINTLSVPINNALNTTHTANDNYTFRLSKINYTGNATGTNNTEYFYIIGTYIYITKNLDTATAAANPHYLGFSPSTNVTLKDMLNNGTSYLYPNKILEGLMVDSSDPTIKYSDMNDKESTNTYALMKDIFITPSLYMTLNESVGDV